jgi:hypothetical protein
MKITHWLGALLVMVLLWFTAQINRPPSPARTGWTHGTEYVSRCIEYWR